MALNGRVPDSSNCVNLKNKARQIRKIDMEIPAVNKARFIKQKEMHLEIEFSKQENKKKKEEKTPSQTF